ncbi:MAG: [FeFe] hydrogenase H-cluster maturation GTPase HydF [Clostridiales bacterium]|nr:[FeFe] hydrogenase H-cluster maturation GTPase HydF [Clostridiales bacterium]
MGLNDTPSGERVHIGFFGKRNAGKSSVVNAVTGQDLAVVSETKGTTTDPVKKAMELLPIGPVMIIDTPGFDDTGSLGEKRVRKTRQILNRTDVALLVVDATEGLTGCDQELIRLFEEKEIPYLIVYNKADLLDEFPGSDDAFDATSRCTGDQSMDDSSKKALTMKVNREADSISENDQIMKANRDADDVSEKALAIEVNQDNTIYVSALKQINIYELKEKIAQIGNSSGPERHLVADLVSPMDLVVLVVPIDSAAPKGRLILPQQQVIRDLLEAGAAPVCVRETELDGLLRKLGQKPAMVITDSQAFGKVSAVVPEDVLLTSFSILMARYKGFLDEAVQGVTAIDRLQDGDRVLIAEGCTHHRQCDDIGTVKLPRWLKNHTGKELNIETCSGLSFPEDLSSYALVIHCGGCMLNEREMRYRMKCTGDQGIPFTNYGTAIAYMHGILKRSVEIFPHLTAMLD